MTTGVCPECGSGDVAPTGNVSPYGTPEWGCDCGWFGCVTDLEPSS